MRNRKTKIPKEKGVKKLKRQSINHQSGGFSYVVLATFIVIIFLENS